MSGPADAGDARRAPVTVLGAGSWGTALAMHLARAGRPVRLWARDPALAASMRARRENPRYLPGATLPEGVSVTADAGEALADGHAVLVAVPSHFVDAMLTGLGRARRAVRGAGVGDEGPRSRAPPAHERAHRRRCPAARVAVLSGPTFAREVALGRPTRRS